MGQHLCDEWVSLRQQQKCHTVQTFRSMAKKKKWHKKDASKLVVGFFFFFCCGKTITWGPGGRKKKKVKLAQDVMKWQKFPQRKQWLIKKRKKIGGDGKLQQVRSKRDFYWRTWCTHRLWSDCLFFTLIVNPVHSLSFCDPILLTSINVQLCNRMRFSTKKKKEQTPSWLFIWLWFSLPFILFFFTDKTRLKTLQ